MNEKHPGCFNLPHHPVISGVLPAGDEWPDAELRGLLKLADRALYEAKRAGRDTVRIAAETSLE
ncbi:GGDEF domain-containing protein [Paenibacillus rhizosphaerae]|uniref:GGDEF domain-containing protein n=1 Tax=Paenibacillus rhizosphaerae TaxID=297318 RepID=A0A839TPD6_9BACL|nr:hypothetical protein [Paenibacillus rhizosphaerae]MBB3126617.1 GGDEF domain-containing protein [Paenibacillus rhizosphaerae]